MFKIDLPPESGRWETTSGVEMGTYLRVKAENAALKKLVREMGVIIKRGFAYSLIADQKEIGEEILNRPEVKAIMEEVKGG